MSISFKEVEYIYSPKTPFEYHALKNINTEIKLEKITAIIGNTGSGKSTLIQHLNALLLPTKGRVEVCDFVIEDNKKIKNSKELRKRVGLVFQFPEYQLFEETILKDVMYGPLNFEVPIEQAQIKAIKALELVGIDKTYFNKSPLELSGGEKRKVAIAGVLAMSPEILVFDEPVAGLDPQSALNMMNLFKTLNEKYHKTIIFVSHNMEQVLKYSDYTMVLKDGEVIYNDKTKEFFIHDEILDKLHIAAPMIIKTKRLLKEKGITIPQEVLSLEELAKYLAKVVKK